ncbi:MAG: hypothetical protein EPO68_03600 [Planctomycetota bacterium]|nr:MAG: hypothetical protein EPO68_03600 [Planctomycetota bacterium]
MRQLVGAHLDEPRADPRGPRARELELRARQRRRIREQSGAARAERRVRRVQQHARVDAAGVRDEQPVAAREQRGEARELLRVRELRLHGPYLQITCWPGEKIVRACRPELMRSPPSTRHASSSTPASMRAPACTTQRERRASGSTDAAASTRFCRPALASTCRLRSSRSDGVDRLRSRSTTSAGSTP